MRTTTHDVTFEIAGLTACDVQLACSSAFPDEDDYWSSECVDLVHRAATEVLRSAQAARAGRRGVALEAVTRRHGFLTAALMDSRAAAAWTDARRTLEGCYGRDRATRTLHAVARNLFLSRPTTVH